MEFRGEYKTYSGHTARIDGKTEIGTHFHGVIIFPHEELRTLWNQMGDNIDNKDWSLTQAIPSKDIY